MASATQIASVEYFRAVSPQSMAIADSTHEISEIAFIVARLRLHSGVCGEAYLLSFHYSPEAIVGALKDMRKLVLGFEVNETGAFLRQCEREAEYFGISGIQRWAMGLLNLAMWDAWGRHLGQPIWKLLGTVHRRVPLYGSGGWLSYSTEELLDEVLAYKSRGFQAVKVKVGSTEIERDIERLHRVREALGPKMQIMIDANQGMTLAGARHLLAAVRELGIQWFEEPLKNTDYDGYRQLRREAGVSIAMGEREFDSVSLREWIRHEAIDLWQPDILRLGGVEPWLASAALAGAHQLPVLPHYYKEYDVPLLMTVPNSHGAESFDWIDPLITNPIRMQDGWAYPNEGPGWGFVFKDSFLSPIA
ncbi:MAG: mandelate racemase/muconate lactonizing enzyme family protein [Opitutales bacterium]|nr:mandelate racemase/muconate lactonizing enzyme family protein [Opitutales bacterium]